MDGEGRKRRRRPGAEELVAAAREAHARREGALSAVDFERMTGFKRSQVVREFPGGWTELRELVGIPLHAKEVMNYDEEHLLGEFHRVTTELERIPRWSDIDRTSTLSASVFQTRFGDKQELLRRYSAWLTEREPESRFVSEIEAALRQRRGPRPGGGPRPARPAWQARPDRQAGPPWPARAAGRPVYGEEINFGSLGYAPTNEKGVIYLFGVLAKDLGFRVDAVGSAFPDCEGKRALDPARKQWQTVRIEFEYRSRNFREHGHDAAGCDLIVCWHHDWPECPVEVLELGEVVRAGRAEG